MFWFESQGSWKINSFTRGPKVVFVHVLLWKKDTNEHRFILSGSEIAYLHGLGSRPGFAIQDFLVLDLSSKTYEWISEV